MWLTGYKDKARHDVHYSDSSDMGLTSIDLESIAYDAASEKAANIIRLPYPEIVLMIIGRLKYSLRLWRLITSYLLL